MTDLDEKVIYTLKRMIRTLVGECSMMRFSKISYSVVIALSVILTVDLTILFAQTNDAPTSEEANPSNNTNKSDTAAKIELKPEDSVSPRPTGNVDPATKVELQQLFNELRKEYLDTRAESVNWWLEFIAIVLAFFGIVIVVVSFLGFQEFKRLRTEAKEDTNEIKNHLSEVLRSAAELEEVREKAEIGEIGARSDEAIQNMRETLSAEVFATLFSDAEFEKILQDFEQIRNLSFVDRAMVDAYKLQKDGKIKESTQKWRSVANIVSGIDENLAARAWGSVGYLLSEQGWVEKAIFAYDKAIKMKTDYAEAYYNRGRQKVKSGQYLDGIKDLDEAINLNFGEAKVYVVRGIANFELGKRDDAFTDFDRAIYIKPDYPNAHAIRGQTKARLNDTVGAKVDFQNALGLAKEQGEKDLIDAIERDLYELNERG